MQNKEKIGKYFLLLTSVVLIQSFLQDTENFKIIFGKLMGYLMPFIYAVFFAIILQPLSFSIERKLNCKRGLSILAAILIAVLFMAGVVVGIFPGETESIKEITVRMPEFQEKLQGSITKIFEFSDIILKFGNVSNLLEKEHDVRNKLIITIFSFLRNFVITYFNHLFFINKE